MIIRSQNKKGIINFNNIDTIGIEPNYFGYDVAGYNGTKESCVTLGEYSTEEKAIKVLDMIQNVYIQYGTIKDGLGSIHGAFNIPKCFQMPSDEEVEA